MDSLKDVKEWLRRANGNLARAQSGRIDQRYLFEDLCYNAQQAETASKDIGRIHKS